MYYCITINQNDDNENVETPGVVIYQQTLEELNVKELISFINRRQSTEFRKPRSDKGKPRPRRDEPILTPQ